MTHNDIPRRAYVQKQVPAERAIQAAIDAVESLGADVLLTEAVTLLGRAKDKVGDFIDSVSSAPPSATGAIRDPNSTAA